MQNIYLKHHGIKGQRWGIRRFQNEDGSLTPRGKKQQEKAEREEQRKINFPLISAYEKGTKVFGAIAGAGVLMGLTSTALDLKGLTSSSVGRTKVSNALMTIGGIALLAGTVAGTATYVTSGVKNLKLREKKYKED